MSLFYVGNSFLLLVLDIVARHGNVDEKCIAMLHEEKRGKISFVGWL